MTAERWERIKAVFDSALDCGIEGRGSFVERACAGDEEFRLEVSRLLAEYERAGNFLDEPAASVGQALAPGDLISNRYRIVQIIGSGGMGEVYRANDELLNEPIALKTLRADLAHDQDLLRRFQKEIQLARKVTHTNVCRVFEVGVHEFPGRPPAHFFTMELLEGETLAARIRRQGRLSRVDAFPLIVQMAAGLQAAHEAGIIHRDFKSGNVVLTGDRAVITDFGLARRELAAIPSISANSVTAPSLVAGTIAYMSPEQLTGGAITPASDIYSFGIVLYEMATGELPFDASHIIQSAVQRATGEVAAVRSLAPDIDPRWELAIDRCLKLNPEERFRTMAETARLLRDERPLAALVRPAGHLRSARRAGLIVAFFLVAFVALFFFVSRFSYRGP